MRSSFNPNPRLSLVNLIDERVTNPILLGEFSARAVTAPDIPHLVFVQALMWAKSAVLHLGNWKHVIGIDAKSHLASMVKFLPIRDVTDSVSIDNTMSSLVTAPDVNTTVDGLLLPTGIMVSSCSLPDPARSLESAIFCDPVVDLPRTRHLFGNVTGSVNGRFAATAFAKVYRHLRVASLVEVAHGGRRTWNPLAPFYAMDWSA